MFTKRRVPLLVLRFFLTGRISSTPRFEVIMMKLIAVDCSRATDTEDDHPRRCVVFARDKDEAESYLAGRLTSGMASRDFTFRNRWRGPLPRTRASHSLRRWPVIGSRDAER